MVPAMWKFHSNPEFKKDQKGCSLFLDIRVLELDLISFTTPHASSCEHVHALPAIGDIEADASIGCEPQLVRHCRLSGKEFCKPPFLGWRWFSNSDGIGNFLLLYRCLQHIQFKR